MVIAGTTVCDDFYCDRRINHQSIITGTAIKVDCVNTGKCL